MECWNCGRRGHRSTECPQGRNCSRCGRSGHIARFCGQHVRDADNATVCWNCGQTGHDQACCPKPQRQCHGCGQYGHIRLYCGRTGRERREASGPGLSRQQSRQHVGRQGGQGHELHTSTRPVPSHFGDASPIHQPHVRLSLAGQLTGAPSPAPLWQVRPQSHGLPSATYQWPGGASPAPQSHVRLETQHLSSALQSLGIATVTPQQQIRPESQQLPATIQSFGGASPVPQGCVIPGSQYIPSDVQSFGVVYQTPHVHVRPDGQYIPSDMQSFAGVYPTPQLHNRPESEYIPPDMQSFGDVYLTPQSHIRPESHGFSSTSQSFAGARPKQRHYQPSSALERGKPQHSVSSSQSSSSPDHQQLPYPSEFLSAWLPHLHSDVYIIPPVHTDTVHVRKVHTSGDKMIDVLKTQQEIDSDSSREREISDIVHIDRVLKKVHYCMKQIKKKAERKKERMVIMTQAKCGLYGAGSRSLYEGAAARNTNSGETEPLDLNTDFVDLLVIHPHHGIMMAAIIRQTGEDPHAVEEEVRKAADYLKQAGDVVRRSVLSDLATQPAVHQAILLPDTTRHCLEEALRNMDDLQELEERLGVEPGRNIGHYCLCRDEMSDERKLDAWWTTCLKRNEGGDRAMNHHVYEQLVLRFAVPLTTVEVYLSREPRVQLWSQGHVVHAVGEEHGRPISRVALFPQQFQVLEETPDDDDDVRILHGPTGTAKTVVLVLKGVQWLRKGCGTVFDLQTSYDGTAAAYLVRHQVSETVGQGAGSVQLVNMAGTWNDDDEEWTEEGEKKLSALCQHADTHGHIHIIADEANCDLIAEIYRTLKQRNIIIHLWGAGVMLQVPADMERYVRYLTEPLRCPPAVVREVEQADDMKEGRVPAYTSPPVAPPCEGPPVITVTHYGYGYLGDTQGHEGHYPWRCEKCGQLVADILNSLRVGCHDNAPHGQGGLTYSDVFVLGDMDCDTDITDDNPWSPAPFIRGLESRGVPTRKVDHNDTAAVRQLAEMTSAPTHTGARRRAGEGRAAGGQGAPGRRAGDQVTLAHHRTVWGLERKIVVFLESEYGVSGADFTGRLRCMSRATAQVIWVKVVIIDSDSDTE